MLFSIFVFALPIIISDLHRKKIPNIYLTYTAVFIFPFLVLHGLGRLDRLLICLVCILSLTFLHLGMGDIKLLWLITLALNPNDTSDFLALHLLILLTASFHILLITASKRAFPLHIPLAPSIFIGLALYLAAR